MGLIAAKVHAPVPAGADWRALAADARARFGRGVVAVNRHNDRGEEQLEVLLSAAPAAGDVDAWRTAVAAHVPDDTPTPRDVVHAALVRVAAGEPVAPEHAIRLLAQAVIGTYQGDTPT